MTTTDYTIEGRRKLVVLDKPLCLELLERLVHHPRSEGRIVAEDCPYCDGTGAFPEGECGACQGLGWI